MPHEWSAYLYKSFHGLFYKLFMGTNGAAEGKRKLMAFWGTIKEHDPGRHALRPGMPKDRTIPRWIHGDGVPCTKNDTMEVCSWGSMLSKWMWFASGYMNKVRNMLPRRGNKDNDTKAVFVKILPWISGRWPWASSPPKIGKGIHGPRTPRGTRSRTWILQEDHDEQVS